jgi:hypothetical protein
MEDERLIVQNLLNRQIRTEFMTHVRWYVYQPQNAYRDVVVHEAAHLLHLLKPEHFDLHIKRGQSFAQWLEEDSGSHCSAPTENPNPMKG